MTDSRPVEVIKRSTPSLVSVCLHVLIFVLIMFVPWAIQREPKSKGLIIAATQLEPGAQDFQFEDTPDREKQEQTENVIEEQDWAKKPAENLLRELTERASAKDAIISLGPGAGGGAALAESAADRMKIGAGSQGPKFFGVGGAETQAKRIVYVVDRSGSMINTFDALVRELESSVDRLTYTQSFHIIFFSEKRPVENPPRRLVPAIKVHKHNAFKFLKTIVPEGRTDPIDAMRRAFEVKPDIIFFLTDGEFNPDLLKKLNVWNKKKQVMIYTYAYVYQPGKQLLEKIAREHGGQYKFISEDDIF